LSSFMIDSFLESLVKQQQFGEEKTPHTKYLKKNSTKR
jgi:hypothetical protein